MGDLDLEGALEVVVAFLDDPPAVDTEKGRRFDEALRRLLAAAPSAVPDAVFFPRFWRSSRDKLFLAFAAAFTLMAAAQVLLVVADGGREADGHVYLPRLAAFVIIILAFLAKNLPPMR